VVVIRVRTAVASAGILVVMKLLVMVGWRNFPTFAQELLLVTD